MLTVEGKYFDVEAGDWTSVIDVSKSMTTGGFVIAKASFGAVGFGKTGVSSGFASLSQHSSALSGESVATDSNVLSRDSPPPPLAPSQQSNITPSSIIGDIRLKFMEEVEV